MSRLFVLVAAVAMCCGGIHQVHGQETAPVNSPEKAVRSGSGGTVRGGGAGFVLSGGGGGGLAGAAGGGAGGGGGLAGLRGAAVVETVPVVDFEAILDRPVKPEFADTPLADVVDFLAGQFDINIQLDEKGLTDAAIDPGVPVTFSLRKPVSLRAALQLILGNLELTYVVKDEVLLITSQEKADEVLTTEVYYVGDLTGAQFGVSRKWGPLMQIVVSTVQPDTWDDNGGSGSIQPFSTGDALVISQKAEVQRELKDLFAKLREELKEHKVAEQGSGKEPFTRAYTLGTASGEQTAEAIRKLIAPQSWKESGGEGEIAVINRIAATEKAKPLTGDVLFVRQTADVHQQIDDLLISASLTPISGGMGGMGGGSGGGTGKLGSGSGGGMGGGSIGGGLKSAAGAQGETAETPAKTRDKP